MKRRTILTAMILEATTLTATLSHADVLNDIC